MMELKTNLDDYNFYANQPFLRVGRIDVSKDI